MRFYIKRRRNSDMIDRFGKKVKIGDFVSYFQRIDSRPQYQIGEVVGFDDGMAIIKYSTANREADYSRRTKSGITLMTSGEAMLAVLEKSVIFD